MNEDFYEDDEPIDELLDVFDQSSSGFTGKQETYQYDCKHFTISSSDSPWCFLCDSEMTGYTVKTSANMCDVSEQL